MKIRKAQSSWIKNNGYRFDCNPYVSGAIEAVEVLEKLSITKQTLKSLTCGHAGGIYNGPVFKRRFVTDPNYGVPFLTSGNMLRLDLSDIQYLSAKDANSKRLSYLKLKPGMIMISCSGAIGNMVYVRDDMEGYWSCQDQLKVVANTDKILPGFLYSFLGSKYGLPIILSGTYGAIVQHLEPVHIENMRVPRFDELFEAKIDRLVTEASQLRTLATERLKKVSKQFDSLLGDTAPIDNDVNSCSVSSKVIQNRFDAQFHDPTVKEIRDKISAIGHVSIGEWCRRVFLPGIFKRIHIDSLEHGAYYYTGAALFTLEPQPKGILSKQTSKFDEVYLEKGMILVQAFGQDGGLTGRSVWVGDHLDKQTTTHMLVRLQSDNLKKDAFLFGFLQSDLAYRQIACLTYGGSIPHFDEAGISTVLMPLFDEETFNQIAEDVLWAVDARDRALDNEKLARQLVEEAIEEMVEN